MATALTPLTGMTRSAPQRRRTAPRIITRVFAASSQLAFILFLLVNINVFLRPAEMIPALLGLPIYQCLILGSLVFSLNDIRDRLTRLELYRQPITVCVLGVWGMVAVSHLMHAYTSGAIEGFLLFMPTGVYYLLLVSLITTPARFRWFLITTTLAACIMVTLCVVDYVGWVDFKFINHYVEQYGETNTGSLDFVVRMRGTGVFEDPNDISLLIVASGTLCMYYLLNRRYGWARFAWLIPMGFLLAGLLCTKSRGGLLATGFAGMILIQLRYGGTWTLILGALAIIAVPLVAGRQADIDLEDGTGQDRIQIWAEGMSELKSPGNLPFGVGQGMYSDIVGLVAHNSFVHAFVELGFVGGTFFFGSFFFAVFPLLHLVRKHIRLSDPELQRFGPFLIAILGGWGMGLMSLSRCYVAPTYMVLGMAASYLRLAAEHRRPPQLLVAWDRKRVQSLVIASALTLFGLYGFARVFSN